MLVAADFSRTLPCTIDLAGSTGPLYNAVVECKDIANTNNFSAIKIWLKNGNFFNNEIVFPNKSDDPQTISFFFLNASAPIPVPAEAVPFYIPGTESPSILFVSEAATIDSAVMSIDFNSLAQGAPVVGTLHLIVGDKDKTIIGGVFTGTISSVQ